MLLQGVKRQRAGPGKGGSGGSGGGGGQGAGTKGPPAVKRQSVEQMARAELLKRSAAKQVRFECKQIARMRMA